MTTIIEIKNLSITLNRKNEASVSLIHGIDLAFTKGKITGVVGESGSGKSLSMKAIMGLLPENLTQTSEHFTFDGEDVPQNNRKSLSAAMIFQDPMTALNPLRTIEFHLIEVIRRFQKVSKKEARQLALTELVKVGLTQPEKRLKQYPHELSGGMRQRVMIAMALLAKPDLLIADEPTTALDVTIQAQILALIKTIQQTEQLSIILVTHDFGIVAGMCEEIKVMYNGYIVEEGTTEEVFYQPKHLYTQELLKAIPKGEQTTRLYAVDHESLASLALNEATFSHVSKTHRYLIQE